MPQLGTRRYPFLAKTKDILSPDVGDIRKASELGLKGGGYRIWDSCRGCNMGHWVKYSNFSIKVTLCRKCAAIKCSKAGADSPAWKGFQIINSSPIIGEERLGRQIGRKGGSIKYRFVLCEKCGDSFWKSSQSKIGNICLHCSAEQRHELLRSRVRKHIGTLESPCIGDVRFAGEVGRGGKGLYIWLPCAKCGVPRWVVNLRGVEHRYCYACHGVRNGKQRAIRWDVVELRYLYENRQLSRSDIARLKDCSTNAVQLALDKYGIATRKRQVAMITEGNRSKQRAIGVKKWANEEYKEQQLKKMVAGMNIKPNKPEKFITSMLSRLYPNQWMYTGDFGVVIGGKSPDWANCNGRKAVILFHGLYWHLWRHQIENPNLTKDVVEQRDIAHYREYGYGCLIIWEDELKDIDSVVNRIRQFHGEIGAVECVS